MVERGVTRGRFLKQGGIAALGAAGLYSLVDGLAPPVARALSTRLSFPLEQHLLRDLRVVRDNDVVVVIPPLHHQITTARLNVGRGKADLLDAKRALEQALARIDRAFPPTPSGLGVTVGWGRSYFRDRLPRLADGRRFPHYLPVDVRASRAAGTSVPALLDSLRFPSDPHDVALEHNDVCLLFRSDSLEHVATASTELFKELSGLLEITSIRKGFVGGGGSSAPSLPKQMAVRAGIPGAARMPDHAQLFLGFTSTQKKALGPDLIANTETLPGLTDQWPDGYFRHGTTMHVSHLHEDLETWYESFSYIRRVWATFRPGLVVADGTLTVPEGPRAIERIEDIAYDARDKRLIGHSGALQPASRLAQDVVDNHRIRNPKGTTVIQRADFNSLDNPFFWSARPRADRMSHHPAAGLHFVAFTATSDSFHRIRLAMDGHYAGGVRTAFAPRAEEQGMNSVLRTTHRQNFLVPPRKHRSFPLAELL
jgi:hypothetical protein